MAVDLVLIPVISLRLLLQWGCRSQRALRKNYAGAVGLRKAEHLSTFYDDGFLDRTPANDI